MEVILRLVPWRSHVMGLQRFLYLLMFSFSMWVIYLVNSKPTNINITSDFGNHFGNKTGGLLHSRQDFIPEVIGATVDRNILAEEKQEENCNFQDYVFRQRVSQMDPCLIAAVKKNVLLSPPPQKQNLPRFNPAWDIAGNLEKFEWLEKLVMEDNITTADPRWPGFFIECGANNGHFISSTLRLERNHNWTGLLVEANPAPFKKLKQMGRNAWAANVAACPTEYPDQLMFYTNSHDMSIGGAGLKPEASIGVTYNFTVQCIPLYTMLAALEVTTVDFLSLDVEGFELAILKTIPFEQVLFKVMAVEYRKDKYPGERNELTPFLESKGYRFVKEIKDYYSEDLLYAHKSLYAIASQLKI